MLGFVYPVNPKRITVHNAASEIINDDKLGPVWPVSRLLMVYHHRFLTIDRGKRHTGAKVCDWAKQEEWPAVNAYKRSAHGYGEGGHFVKGLLRLGWFLGW